MVKRLIQRDITILKKYSPNIGSLKYIKQILTDIKGQMNSNTIIVGDFNTLLTSTDRELVGKNWH